MMWTICAPGVMRMAGSHGNLNAWAVRVRHGICGTHAAKWLRQ